MAEKIEMFAGWDWDSSVIVGREMNQHLPNRCTVVVHDDKAERVFTESEVRAIVQELEEFGGFNGLQRHTLRKAGLLDPA